MAAGLGYKEFTTGDVLTAADANGYLASQVVMVFASAAARTSAIASPQEGMFSYLKDTNSTEYYSGSAWVALGGGATALPSFSAYANTNQSFSTATWTKVTLGTEEWDTNTNFASSRFTPTVAGYYTISGRVDLSGFASASTGYVTIYKNGSLYKVLFSMQNAYNSSGAGGTSTVYFNGSTDYVELYVYMSTGTPVITGGSTEASWFNGVGVRA